MAISPYQINYSQEARYAVFSQFFSMLSIYFLWNIFNNEKEKIIHWLLYFVSIVCSLYTFYYAFFLLFSQNLIVFLLKFQKKSFLKRWISTQIIILLSIIPFFPTLLHQSQSRGVSPRLLTEIFSRFIHGSFFNMIDIFFYFFAGTHFDIHEDSIIIKTIFLTLLSIFLVTFLLLIKSYIRSKNKDSLAFVVGHLLVPIICAYLFNEILRVPLFPKMCILISPMFYLILSYMLYQIHYNFLKKGIIVILIVVSLVCLVMYYLGLINVENNRSIVKYIHKHERKNDLILVDPAFNSCIIEYYYKGKLTIMGITRNHNIVKNDYEHLITVDKLNKFSKKIKKYNRIWLYLGMGISSPTAPDGVIKRWFDMKYKKVLEKTFSEAPFFKPRAKLILYEK